MNIFTVSVKNQYVCETAFIKQSSRVTGSRSQVDHCLCDLKVLDYRNIYISYDITQYLMELQMTLLNFEEIPEIHHPMTALHKYKTWLSSMHIAIYYFKVYCCIFLQIGLKWQDVTLSELFCKHCTTCFVTRTVYWNLNWIQYKQH